MLPYYKYSTTFNETTSNTNYWYLIHFNQYVTLNRKPFKNLVNIFQKIDFHSQIIVIKDDEKKRWDAGSSGFKLSAGFLGVGETIDI